MLRGDVTITTIDLSCVKIMSVKLYSEYRILWASLCASFVLISQNLREWHHLSAYQGCKEDTPRKFAYTKNLYTKGPFSKLWFEF